MKNIGIYILPVLISTLVSCKTRVEYVPVKVKEKVIVETKDTIIKEELVPYEKRVEIPIAAGDTVSRLSTPYAYSRAGIRGGILFHELGTLPGTFIDLNIPKLKTITKEKEVPMIREVEVEKNLSLWEKIKIKFGGLSMSLNTVMLLVTILGLRKKSITPWKEK